MGSHTIAHWSSTQATIALSVAEAELNAMIKGSVESLFIKHLAEEMGLSLGIELQSDSSAAKGILSRQGCGKVKHLETRQLWLQEKVLEKTVVVKKIPREINPSDALTHYWSYVDAVNHFKKISVKFQDDLSAYNVQTFKPRGGVEIKRPLNLYL